MDEPTPPDTNNSFLFRDQEFDDAEFDSVAFVARYRRVASLESLREQLQGYSNHVRKQLYAIINRDYKDFITITTKLDGLDTRAEMIAKPLYTIQMDLSSLHNGISTSLHLIKDKIDQQQDIALRKSTLQRVLQVHSNLDLARTALNTSDTILPNESQRGKLHKQQSLVKESYSKDLFVCSEYERAAVALHDSHQDIAAVVRDNQQVKLLAPPLLQDLTKRYSETRENLLHQLKTHLEHYFSSAATTPNQEKSVPSSAADRAQLRCFLHCIRALIVLQQITVAEGALRSVVIDPYLKGLITGGKVDGKGGRGSYSGLTSLFEEYLTWLKTSRLLVLLQAIDGSAREEIVVKGVYLPLVRLLRERCPAMLSVGITTVFSNCFRAVDSLIPRLSGLFLENVDGCFWSQAEVQTFYTGWKIDLYSQLRTREVMLRLDKACEVEIRSFLSRMPSASSLVSQLYLPKATSRAAGANEDNTQSKLGISLSLTPEVTQALLTTADKEHSLLQYHHEVYKVWVIESMVLCHEQVALRPLKSFFVGLLFRSVQRLALHLSLLAQAPLSFSSASTQQLEEGSEESFDTLRQGYLTLKEVSPAATTAGTVAAAPVPPVATAVIPSLAAEEIVLHLLDLQRYSTFISSFLQRYLLDCMSGTVAASPAGMALVDRSVQDGVLTPLTTVQTALWSRVMLLFTADCKRPLAAVKTIPGKYRMTNRPSPKSASSYVAEITQSLDTLRERHTDAQLDTIAGHSSQWRQVLLEDIAGYFLEQVTNLVETVRQMDSALQRRAAGRSTAPTSASKTEGQALTDSEKTYLQVKIDVEDFVQRAQRLVGADKDVMEVVPTLKQLLQVVQEQVQQPSSAQLL